MNRIERKLVLEAITVIMMRVDQLVETGMHFPDAKEKALKGFTFVGLLVPFQRDITAAVDGATLADLSGPARKAVFDSIYQLWLGVNKRKDSLWSKIRFWIWL